MGTSKWKEISVIAQKRRDDALAAAYSIPEISETDLPKDLRTYPKQSGLFTAEELEILELDAVQILQKIKERKLTSVAATKAFSKAAAVAQKLVWHHLPTYGDLN
jgi:amidase